MSHSKMRIGLIGGTSLGEAIGASTNGTRHRVETPFGPTSDEIIETQWANVTVLVLSRHGPGHVLNPSRVPYRANIFALRGWRFGKHLRQRGFHSLREKARLQMDGAYE